MKNRTKKYLCFACKHVNTKTDQKSLFRINHYKHSENICQYVRYFPVVIDDTCQYIEQEGVKPASIVPSKMLSYF